MAEVKCRSMLTARAGLDRREQHQQQHRRQEAELDGRSALRVAPEHAATLP